MRSSILITLLPVCLASPKPSTSPPSGCPNIPASVTITAFKWFNSTHNLDCANPNYPAGSQVCLDKATFSTLCEGPESDTCHCVPFCYTGLPQVAYQPYGFGPRDTLDIHLDLGGGGRTQNCSAVLSSGFRDYELGQGHFSCGSAADYIGFTGDSNADSGTGNVYYNNYGSTCRGQTPRYQGDFPLLCHRDAGGNATCTTTLPVVLPFVGLR